MTLISFEHGDNFIRNVATIKDGGSLNPPMSFAPIMTATTLADPLPVSLETFADHLRVDDFDAEKSTLEIMLEGAADFLEIRTCWAMRPKRYQFHLNELWQGGLTIHRGPLRGNVKVEVQTANGVWESLAPDDIWALGQGKQIKVRALSWPDIQPWQPQDCIRVSFEAGFDNPAETGSIAPIDAGMRMLLLMIGGHYYKNRELIGTAAPKFGMEAVEIGATSILGAYRSYY